MISTIAFFQSNEIEMAKRIFKTILAKDWFERSHDNEQALAQFIARCIQKGMKEEDHLCQIAESAAKMKWAKTQDLAALPVNGWLTED